MAAGGPKFICSCYFSHNIFLHQYRQHVTFHNEKQFTKDFRAVSLNAVFSKSSSMSLAHGSTRYNNQISVQVLEEKGCDTQEKFQKALAQVWYDNA